jgi:DNA-binding FrmR family transcriptional regulator
MPSQLEAITHKRGGLHHLPQAKRDILRRIRTVRGHLEGIETMVEDERYCVEILKQIAAVQASLSQVAQMLTKGHMQTCLTEAIQSGQGEEKIEELMEVFKYLKNY